MTKFEHINPSLAREISKENIIEESRNKVAENIEAIKNLIENAGGPEEFYSSARYESAGELEQLLRELAALSMEAIKEGEFDMALDIGRQALEASGIEGARTASVQSPDGMVAIAEATNWAAKVISYGFYGLKPAMIVAAAQDPGVYFGIGDDGAYYLGSPTIGMASFHDPNDEIGYIMVNHLKQRVPRWEYPWSGISRQEDSFVILKDLGANRELADKYAEATLPEDLKMIRQNHMEESFHNRLEILGNLLKK